MRALWLWLADVMVGITHATQRTPCGVARASTIVLGMV